MWLRASCTLKFDITVPTPFVLMLRPRSGAQQWISMEEYTIVPSVPVFEFTDIYGNLCQRLIAPTEGQQPGYNQVAAITAWLRATIRFESNRSDILVSAIEVNIRQSGVCRDLSHLGIALCRSLSIPSRMVVGYLHGLVPMDLHAWFEAYVGGRWYAFDATQESMRVGYVAIGYSRDAADVAVYNQFGPALYPQSQEISVELINQENVTDHAAL